MSEPQRLQTRVKSVLEDPSSQAVARVYAEAFLDAAAATGVDAVLEEYQSLLDDVLDRNPEFDRMLRSGLLSKADQLALLERVIIPRASPLFGNFLRVLARHDRLELLPVILRRARVEHERRSGRRRVQVTSARPLSPAALDAVTQRLAAIMPFQPIVETWTDPSLLGGLVIRVGDTVYDGSLRARVKQLRSRLRQGFLNEIQSGRNRFSHSE